MAGQAQILEVSWLWRTRCLRLDPGLATGWVILGK